MFISKKTVIEKIVNSILNALIFIFALILLLSIYIGIQTKALRNDYANFFGYSLFEVQTGSMAEEINAGDWIIVKLTKKIKLNDVITYKLNDQYITHRVVEVYNGTYVTKGDANNAKDKPIDKKNVVGKVTKTLGSFGILRATLFNPAVLTALIITLLIFSIALSKNKKVKEKIDYRLLLNKIIFNLKICINKILKQIKNIPFVKDKIIGRNHINQKNYEKPLKDEVIKDITKEHLISELNFDKNSYEVKSEDELQKTSVFRVITVDNDEVNETFKKEETYKDLDIDIKESTNSEEIENEELEKTAYFRMISVEDEQLPKKYKATTNDFQELSLDEDQIEAELDKTSYFRMISVDADEVEKTLSQVESNYQIEDKKPVKEIKKVVEEIEEVEEVDLKFLNQKSNKKGKNIVDTVILNKREELLDLINVFVDLKLNDKKNEIRSTFLEVYINAKYYNYYGEKISDYNGKDSLTKIKKILNEHAENLSLKIDQKSNDALLFYTKVFMVIASIENSKHELKDLNSKKTFYFKEISKYFKQWNDKQLELMISKILKIQTNYVVLLNYWLKKLETNMFELVSSPINTKKNMHALDLKHNINFSKVYSDYIIDKTYDQGVIAEDKIIILATLMLSNIIKDMIFSNFNQKYIFYIPSTLYQKEKKLKKVLNLLEDNYVKDNTLILIDFEILLNNKSLIKDIKKRGYQFAINIENDKNFKVKNKPSLYIGNYIFVDKKQLGLSSLKEFLPVDLKQKIIYDTIMDKVGGNFGD